VEKDNLPSYLKRGTYQEVFPHLEKLEVTAEQDTHGYYLRRGVGKSNYCIVTAPGTIQCRNKDCRRGGFDLQNYLEQLVRANQMEGECKLLCDGDEGTPSGRKTGKPCMNNCVIVVKLEYKRQSET
jgi:hypothetical protein